MRFEQEKPSTSSSSTLHVSLEYLASSERQDWPEPVRVQNSGHVDDDTHFCVGCRPRDGWTKESLHPEVLDWYREEDAGDLRSSELNQLVENTTCLNALEGETWKSERKVGKVRK